MRRFAPQQIGIWGVGNRAIDRHLEPAGHAIESFGRAFASQEAAITGVNIARDQPGRVGVGPRDQDRRHVENVGRQPGRGQRADEVRRRHQHFSAQVAALFLAGQLILEMHGRGARLDHPLHQLEGVQGAAETGLGIGHDRQEIILVAASLGVLNLVGPAKGIIDPPHDVRHAVGRIKALIRIHLAGVVRIGRDLPAAEIDRLQAGLGHFDRLVAGQRTNACTYGLLCKRSHRRSAPNRARLCSTCTLPRRRATSSAVYSRQIPSQRAVGIPTLLQFSDRRAGTANHYTLPRVNKVCDAAKIVDRTVFTNRALPKIHVTARSRQVFISRQRQKLDEVVTGDDSIHDLGGPLVLAGIESRIADRGANLVELFFQHVAE